MGGQNIGDLLDQAGDHLGLVPGRLRQPQLRLRKPGHATPVRGLHGSHKNIGGATVADYSPHHEPFQYYSSTANPTHLPPTSIAAIGHQDQANHQYDLKDFLAAADNNNLPAVSYLKAAEYQDGHAGYSDPLDEQTFLVNTINHLEKLPTWRSTAVVIAYDDSDGWYDHQMGPIINQSQTPLDALTGTGFCGTNPAKVPDGQQARCGVGPRQPLLVISPYASTTTSTPPSPRSPRWCGSSRTTGWADSASAAAPPTRCGNADQHVRLLPPEPGRGSAADPGSEHG